MHCDTDQFTAGLAVLQCAEALCLPHNFNCAEDYSKSMCRVALIKGSLLSGLGRFAESLPFLCSVVIGHFSAVLSALCVGAAISRILLAKCQSRCGDTDNALANYTRALFGLEQSRAKDSLDYTEA